MLHAGSNTAGHPAPSASSSPFQARPDHGCGAPAETVPRHHNPAPHWGEKTAAANLVLPARSENPPAHLAKAGDNPDTAPASGAPQRRRKTQVDTGTDRSQQVRRELQGNGTRTFSNRKIKQGKPALAVKVHQGEYPARHQHLRPLQSRRLSSTPSCARHACAACAVRPEFPMTPPSENGSDQTQSQKRHEADLQLHAAMYLVGRRTVCPTEVLMAPGRWRRGSSGPDPAEGWKGTRYALVARLPNRHPIIVNPSRNHWLVALE
jgi:hypothetical protein